MPASAQTPADWARADSAIVRLAPEAFPALPVEVRRDLVRRGCRIPQPHDAFSPQNAVSGGLTGAGRRDWAVLCSVRGVSRILIYGAGRASSVDSLAAQADTKFLQTVGDGRIGYSRYVSLVGPRRVQRAAARNGARRPAAVDHDALEDAFEGKASTILYFLHGRWIELPGTD
jgi:hypothetical protein